MTSNDGYLYQLRVTRGEHRSDEWEKESGWTAEATVAWIAGLVPGTRMLGPVGS